MLVELYVYCKNILCPMFLEGAEEDIWASEEGSNRILENIA
jgi:hypothetical protein